MTPYYRIDSIASDDESGVNVDIVDDLPDLRERWSSGDTTSSDGTFGSAGGTNIVNVVGSAHAAENHGLGSCILMSGVQSWLAVLTRQLCMRSIVGCNYLGLPTYGYDGVIHLELRMLPGGVFSGDSVRGMEYHYLIVLLVHLDGHSYCAHRYYGLYSGQKGNSFEVPIWTDNQACATGDQACAAFVLTSDASLEGFGSTFEFTGALTRAQRGVWFYVDDSMEVNENQGRSQFMLSLSFAHNNLSRMVYDIAHIASHTQRQIRRHRKERKRRSKLTKEERVRENVERKRVGRAVSHFVDLAAVEDNTVNDNNQQVEAGYYQLIHDLVPRDRNGRPFLIVFPKRLIKINSDFWWDLTRKQQRVVKHKTRRYQSYLK